MNQSVVLVKDSKRLIKQTDATALIQSLDNLAKNRSREISRKKIDKVVVPASRFFSQIQKTSRTFDSINVISG